MYTGSGGCLRGSLLPRSWILGGGSSPAFLCVSSCPLLGWASNYAIDLLNQKSPNF